MTREEELQQAANNFSEAHKYEEDLDFLSLRIAFEEGVAWADRNPDISSLWHDTSEEPKEDMDILLISKNGKVNKVSKIDQTLYDWLKDNDGIDKWAYISDLLPKGGEK